MTKTGRYSLYDLVIESEVELSLAAARDNKGESAPGKSSWRFEEGPVDASKGRLVHDVADFDGKRRLKVRVDNQRVLFSHGDTRTEWDAKRRRVRLERGPDMSLRPAIMLERVVAPIALLLQRQRHVALHASAVADEAGNAWIFVGDSGAGKSTTALELMRRGMRILADDLVMIDGATGKLLSATPSVRLFDRPKTVPEAIDEQLVMPDRQKYWYQLGSCIEGVQKPEVAGIFSLEPGEDTGQTAIEAVSGREATVRVIAQAFDLTEADSDWRTQRFRTLCQLARDVPVFEVAYQKGDRRRPRQVEALARRLGIDNEEDGDGGDR